MTEEHPAGTLRHQKDDGSWIVAEPHHPLYSLASMFATEYWDDDIKSWVPIKDSPRGVR